MQISVEWISDADQISAADRQNWNRLARNPMQRWEWLGSWWDAYQARYQLCVLSVKRDGETIAFAPWCIQSRVGTGRTLEFLGSGKACTDHVSLLVDPEHISEVCQAIAAFLHESVSPSSQYGIAFPRWDSIEWIGVDRSDPSINGLCDAMRGCGFDVEQSDGLGCYVIELPATWDDYVQMRSKSGRRELRQSLNNIDDGTITIRRVETQHELEDSWETFVNLHQIRRHASGTTGCFDHPPFDTFLRSAASNLLAADLLELTIASHRGIPIAAQFAVADQQAYYFYQSGMDPSVDELRPGMSAFCHLIRDSILKGRTQFDMMRGDEAYKLRWRAKHCPAQEVRVCSPRPGAQLRNQVYKAGVTFKNLVKTGLGISQRAQ